MVNETLNGSQYATNLMGVTGYISRKQNGTIGYYDRDGHGDTVNIYGADGTTKLASYEYDAFGNQKSRTGTWNASNPIRYCGEYYDSESGLIYLRARYYDSENGRFISEDPAKDGYNWYSYCGGNPVMFVDSSGMKYEELRELAETIGAEILWDSNTKTAIVTLDGVTKKFSVDKSIDQANGTTFIDSTNNKMYVWGSDFAKQFGATYSEISGDGYSGYKFTYNREKKQVSSYHIDAISVKITDSASGQKLADEFNSAQNRNFGNQLIGVSALLDVLTEGTAPGVAGYILSVFQNNYVDVSSNLQANERISVAFFAGNASLGRGGAIYQTIIRNRNNAIRVKMRTVY